MMYKDAELVFYSSLRGVQWWCSTDAKMWQLVLPDTTAQKHFWCTDLKDKFLTNSIVVHSMRSACRCSNKMQVSLLCQRNDPVIYHLLPLISKWGPLASPSHSFLLQQKMPFTGPTCSCFDPALASTRFYSLTCSVVDMLLAMYPLQQLWVGWWVHNTIFSSRIFMCVIFSL